MRQSFSHIVFLFAALMLGGAFAAADGPLRLKIADLYAPEFTTTQKVELVGTIVATLKEEFILEDNSGAVWIYSKAKTHWSAGDSVRLICRMDRPTRPNDRRPLVAAYEIETVRKGVRPAIVDMTPSDFIGGKGDNRAVRLQGVITDVFRDEIDPDFLFFTLESYGENVSIACRDAHQHSPDELFSLVDREVSIIGICRPNSAGTNRSPACRTLCIDNPGDFRLLNAIERPTFDSGRRLDPKSVSDVRKTQFPHRQWITGDVLAVWGGNSLYLQVDELTRIRVKLLPNVQPPCSGDRISAAGFVRHIGSFIQLNRTVIRPEPKTHAPVADPPLTDPKSILFDKTGQLRIQSHHDGELIRICGEVRDVSAAGTEDSRLLLDANGITISVLVGKIAPPALKSQIEVTGVCRVEYDADDRSADFLRFTGISLIARSDGDIVLVAAPPWWTPARLTILVGCLLALLLGATVWNRMLHALADRRGAELLAEQIDHITAELKADERTRLSVELHDSLSQTLTGVSFELDAAAGLAECGSESLRQHLSLASRSLESCRTELRNCLWDLRSQALETEDMNEAIRLAIKQVARHADVSIRFNVPRARLLDSTAHTLLRIIRELVSNALRHGKATSIRIAGSVEDGHLLCSVTDNGSGFNPSVCAGTAEGHFGLQGIRERLAVLDGTLEIRSSSGRGTRAVVSLKITQTNEEGA